MIKTVATLFCISLFLLASVQANADSLADANRIIKLTRISQQFEQARLSQTRDIIRTYSLIVNENSQVELPQQVKNSIAECYETNYDFKIFQRGIAQVLVDTYSEYELALLVDFYRDRGVAPYDIEAFKEIVAKADSIQRIAADYIYENSQGCLEQGTQFVIDFVESSQIAQ